jgi:hypothetical protein
MRDSASAHARSAMYQCATAHPHTHGPERGTRAARTVADVPQHRECIFPSSRPRPRVPQACHVPFSIAATAVRLVLSATIPRPQASPPYNILPACTRRLFGGLAPGRRFPGRMQGCGPRMRACMGRMQGAPPQPALHLPRVSLEAPRFSRSIRSAGTGTRGARKRFSPSMLSSAAALGVPSPALGVSRSKSGTGGGAGLGLSGRSRRGGGGRAHRRRGGRMGRGRVGAVRRRRIAQQTASVSNLGTQVI